MQIPRALLRRLEDDFAEERVRSAPDLPGAARALLAWATAHAGTASAVVVTDGPQTLEIAHRDLRSLAPDSGSSLLYYPPWESLPGRDATQDPEITGHRLRTLADLGTAAGGRTGPGGRSTVVATCVQALMQKTLSAGSLRQQTLDIRLGQAAEIETLVQKLSERGYKVGSEVVQKGETAARGGILDVWPLTEPWPLRLEFDGLILESIRLFNPADQRSIDKKESAFLPPASEWLSSGSGGHQLVSLFAHLPSDAVVIWLDEAAIRDRASMYDDVTAESPEPHRFLASEQVRAEAHGRRSMGQILVGGSETLPEARPLDLDMEPIEGLGEVTRQTLQPDVLEQARQRLVANLIQRVGRGHTVIISFDTEGSRDRFTEYAPATAKAGIQMRVGAISAGFVSEGLKLTIVAESDLYGRRKLLGRPYEPAPGAAPAETVAGERLTGPSDIEPGDLVVHAQHGIGRYLGLYEITVNDQRQEVMTIEYAEKAKLHIPLSQAHLLSRYTGLSRQRVELHRLGGRKWSRERAAAEQSIMDLAAGLIETQAHRNLMAGHAFAADTPWQHEFESAFPYEETSDQRNAIERVKQQMETSRPMDLLLCGDAGYGKTEVAMRAAFKAVMSRKQVAVLVPTTVLAQQHYQTFAERLSAFPVRVEMFSRFCGPGARAAILRDLAAGAVDIVIGTHSLLQEDVRFSDLGLVVVDEEQRFGVAHKEWLKRIRRLVDILTLTATPIPRTLYLSMTGARDISLLHTAPRERMAIETIVTPNTDQVVREAILRELSREGQVFYLHNRIVTIDRVKPRIEALVPQARVEIAHGRMASSELASVMKRFAAAEFDVLLCTTIIESGLDIPRANTILIDRADRFGIADLYQLRGRVGRSNHRAYAYLLLPPHGHVDPDARRRIAAVRRYSGSGAGFRLALRDLEIRGAGNILGAAQSGHIAAVGFNLYCQLLRQTIARLKGEPAPALIDVDLRLDFIRLAPAAGDDTASAMIPYTYIDNERIRLGAYRRMAEASTVKDVAEVRADLRDRFGRLPRAVERLLTLAELRIVCAEHGVHRVETRSGKVILTDTRNEVLTPGTRLPRLGSASPDERLREIKEIVHKVERRTG